MGKESGGTDPPDKKEWTPLKIPEYEPGDASPYSINVQCTLEEKNIRNYHPMAIGRILKKLNVQGVKAIRKEGKDRVCVDFYTYISANNFLNNNKFQSLGYKMFIPNNNVTCQGMGRGIAPFLTDTEIMEDLESMYEVLKVRRLNRKTEEGKYEPTGTVIFTFRGTKMPTEIKIARTVVRIVTYIPPVILCFKCMRYGHIAKNCKSQEERCANCTENHQTKECKATTVCRYCKMGHRSDSKDCTEYKKQKQIKEIMVFKNKSYYQAREMVRSESFLRSKEEFPELTNRYEALETISISQREINTKQEDRRNRNLYRNVLTEPSQSQNLVKRKRKIEDGYDMQAHEECLFIPEARQRSQEFSLAKNSDRKKDLDEAIAIVSKDQISRSERLMLVNILKRLASLLVNGSGQKSNMSLEVDNDESNEGNGSLMNSS